MDKIFNDGFIEPSKKDLRESRRKGYVFGAAGGVQGEVINPSGDWSKYWPNPEKQAYVEPERLVETNACTSFGSLNALEALMKLKYGVDVNYSERFLAIVSETDPSVGNDPHKVLEAIRKYGCLDEADLPFSPGIKTREQFYDKTAAWPKLLEKAERWKLSHNFNHEWVFTPEDNLSIEEKRERLKEALTKGSVCVSVKAWKKNDKTGLYYKSRGESDNHWTGKKLRRFEGDNPVIGDSYDPFEKVLEADYNFKYAKILYLNAENVKSLNIMQQIINLLLQVIGIQKKMIEALPVAPIDQTPPPPIVPSKKEYFWATPQHAKHSVRVICDESGLTLKEKNLICAVIQQESGFKVKAKNSNNKNGTTDWGICQFNDGKIRGVPMWIGPGADFASVEEVLNNPEKCVRVMIREYKRGNLKWWVAYSSGAYKKYL